ncbi:helix-hairpin-helix domain-containing protein [Limnoglobus roseus]|uniref:Helix-hairpin-helix domain-containing protein n=1 Tax=Limnoglobus roseus TaxID=2598579 RepID=A0A5C1AE46_9BACT|nr:helix-hairpin-helix domain-containing protein [Limnoglobus roseus]
MCLALFCGLLLYRAYGSQFTTKPSQHLAAASSLNVNAADRTELLQVPGVGPSLADAILSHRSTFGPFTSLDELDGVKGVGGKTVDKLRPWLHVDGQPVARAQAGGVEKLERDPKPLPLPSVGAKKLGPNESINVNTAPVAELQRLPGIGPKLAERIVEARPFKIIEDLRRVGGIGVKTLEKLRPHLRFADPR